MKSPFEIFSTWFHSRNWEAQAFQQETASHIFAGENGLLVAPTGSGKTFALWIPLVAKYMAENPDYWKDTPGKLRVIWITPIRALAKDIQLATQAAVDELGLNWSVGVRTGDTDPKERKKQTKQWPEMLITTPESMHLLLAQNTGIETFKYMEAIVVDEWHELLGTKRGVQIELALSYVRGYRPHLQVWGISATIANVDVALEVLLGVNQPSGSSVIVRSDIQKHIELRTVFPDEIENFPWAGHLGIKLIDKVIPIILEGTTTLIFTNTRAQAEIWYQQLLETAPELSGLIAMHHGSIAQELREWVEDMLHTEKLKAVVCTSSLDLGVDFRPVGQIIQIGGPKGVARFIQRAGRSGHQPGLPSIIYFVPTHALELVEAAALRTAIKYHIVEGKEPLIRSFDVLVQYLVTRAVGGGFDPKQVFSEIKSTFSYASISVDEWQWAIDFITTGGESLGAYDEFKKVEYVSDGRLLVKDRRMAMRHRLSIGTIVSDPSMRVSFLSGKYLGTIEEWFISKLKPGTTFWFAGRNLEFVHIKEMTAFVKKSNKTNGIVPSWQGGRMPFSSQMSELLRQKLEESHEGAQEIEMEKLKPLLAVQNQLSIVPKQSEMLIEQLETKDGHHLFIYPFEGRLVHEGLSALIAYRLSKRTPISFTFAMNDYGFELLSDQPIPVDESQIRELFSEENLVTEIYASINATEMMRRRFREISVIAGLVFTGYPGKAVKNKHLQASGSLFYEVFHTYDPDNQLIRQAMEEVMQLQLEETRLRTVLQRIKTQHIIIKKLERPSPFSFPIIVDWMREKLSSESLEDRIRKMKVSWAK